MQVFQLFCIIYKEPLKRINMKNSKFYTIGFIMLAALFTTTSCDSSDDDQETPEPVICTGDPTTTIILNTSTNKAFPLFSEVDAITNANENFTISPLSLSEMLAMASNGANGETRKQINSLIGANEISKENLNAAFNSLNEYLAKVDSKTTFATANSVWIDEGFNVTVLETSSGLLHRQLDDKASSMLKDIAESKGVKIITNAKISEITGDAVVLEDGTSCPAELVLMSTGMRPYTQLAEEAGIAVDRWVVANERMETSAGSVYAAGDCAVVNGQPQAFWAQAEETGRIAGANAAGDDVVYEPIGSALVMHAFGTAVFSLGTNGKGPDGNPDPKYRCESEADEKAGTYSARFYDGSNLVGAILVGDISAMPELTKQIDF